MGLNIEKAALIGGASDFWTFYRLYIALQPPSVDWLRKGPLENDRQDGARLQRSDRCGDQLVHCAGDCGAGAEHSEYLKLKPRANAARVERVSGRHTRRVAARDDSELRAGNRYDETGAELAGSTGFVVSIASTQLNVSARSNSISVSATYALNSSCFGTWLKLQIFWRRVFSTCTAVASTMYELIAASATAL